MEATKKLKSQFIRQFKEEYRSLYGERVSVIPHRKKNRYAKKELKTDELFRWANIIGEYFDIDPDKLMGRGKKLDQATAKHWLRYMLHIYGEYSMTGIGLATGVRDHTCVVYSVKYIQGQMDINDQFYDIYGDLVSRYEQRLIEIARGEREE